MTKVAKGHAALRVRRMTPQDLRLVCDWSKGEGWNPGLGDGPAFWTADPVGFFVGEIDGEPVACISCVRYGEEFGFLGQYIVRPEYRGRGYGFSVWKAGMAHLAGRNVGLDGVIDQIANYERSGFRLAHYTTRYAGVGGGVRPRGLVPLWEIPIAELIAYDSSCFPASRESFVEAWIANPHALALADVTGGQLIGYGVVRKCITGYKVGPLFADDPAVAERLLAGLAASVPGCSFSVDIPDACVQPGGARLVDRFKLVEVFQTARMYTSGEPVYARHRVFGVTSLELG